MARSLSAAEVGAVQEFIENSVHDTAHICPDNTDFGAWIEQLCYIVLDDMNMAWSATIGEQTTPLVDQAMTVLKTGVLAEVLMFVAKDSSEGEAFYAREWRRRYEEYRDGVRTGAIGLSGVSLNTTRYSVHRGEPRVWTTDGDRETDLTDLDDIL